MWCFKRLLFAPFYVRIHEVQVIVNLEFRAHRLRVTIFGINHLFALVVLFRKNEAAGIKIKDEPAKNGMVLVV